MKDLVPDSVQAYVRLPTSLERSLAGPLTALLCALVLAAGCGDSGPRVRDGGADASIDATDSGGALPDTEALDAARADAADAGSPDTAPDAAADSPVDAAVDRAPDAAADLAVDQAADAAADVAPDVAQSDGGDGAETGDAQAPCTGAGCPSTLAAGHLQLWLRGDQAVQCAPAAALNRVTVWGDLSGHGRDAKPPAGKAGPLCGASTINGRAVIKFARTGALEDGDYLEADLQALVGKPFTIAVVERRPVDLTENVFNDWMIGSALPKKDDVACAGTNMNATRGILFGYVLPALMIAGTWGVDCDLSAFGAPGMAKVARSVLTFAPGVGLTLFSGGTKTGPVASEGLKLLLQAYVGRGYDFAETENRFLGDIAEVVAFDVALSDPERLALDGYLKQLWGGDP